MTDNVEIEVTPASSTRDQFVKLVIGSIAGFAASKVAEKMYDALTEKIRNRNTDPSGS